VSSYGQKTHSSGQVRLTRDLDSSIEGKTVIVVEDILDTGMTLQYLLRLFQQRKPKHLRVAVLLDKPDRRITAVHADYVGFSIPNEFVVGYGLDYAERYRNLPYVGVLLLGPGLKKKTGGRLRSRLGNQPWLAGTLRNAQELHSSDVGIAKAPLLSCPVPKTRAKRGLWRAGFRRKWTT